MELLIYLLISLNMIVIVALIQQVFFTERVNITARLDYVKDMYSNTDKEDILSLPFRERVLNPAYRKLVSFLGKAMPKQIEQSLELTLSHAGMLKKMSVNRFMTIQLMLATVLVSITYLINILANQKMSILAVLFVSVLGLAFPLLYVRAIAKKRQEQIQKSLPALLDLLFVSVEAGLGFDMALKRTIERMEGPLSDEFDQALFEINKGKDRSLAFRDVVKRTGVQDLSSFISAIIQSEKLGSNIASMLRVQAHSMRQKRRQRAEEKAMKIPIKMLFPLIFFMFPALFIVILGPALLRIIAAFTG